MTDTAAKPDDQPLLEGEHDLLSDNVRSRSGGGNLEKTARFTGTPDEEQLRQLTAKLGKGATPAQKRGQGFKQAVAVPSTSGWLLRVRHYVQGKYYRCLQYQGYCPMCLSSTLDKRARNSSDAYLNNLIWFATDIDGNPEYDGKHLIWQPAFTIIGGKKAERIRDKIKMYDGNPAGLVLQTVLTNPEFGDWEVTPYPDRSKFMKEVAEQLCVSDKGTLAWAPHVYEAIEENGLPKEVREKFLCQEITAADAIKQFGLTDQDAHFKELTKDGPRTRDGAASTAKPSLKGAAARRLQQPAPDFDAKDDTPPAEEAGEPEDLPTSAPTGKSAVAGVLDEL